MTFSQGHANLGSIRGAPIRIHWSVPIGAFVFCGFALVPGAWLAFLLLIVCHELGHAFFVRRSGLEVVSVDVHALGGVCRWDGDATPLQRAVIAWGGVVGQLVVLAIAFPLGFVDSPYLQGDFVRQMLHAFVAVNLSLMAINQVPVPPLDGAEAWPLFGMLWRRRVAASKRRREIAERKRAEAARRAAAVATTETVGHLDSLDEEEPPPIPAEVEAVLERILDEAHLAKQARRAKNRG